jgi:L-malate glycosyltransferase
LKIALFTEIFDCGGVDTFIINLINHWPHEQDTFILIANQNYPGLKIIEERVSRQCEILRHNILIYPNYLQTGRKLLPLAILKKLISPLVHYLLIAYNIWVFRKLFRESNPDRLMVINGGYPGGDSCRAAGISWGIFSGKALSIHNYHNIVMPAPWYFRPQEYLVDRFLCRLTASFVTVSRAAAESMAVRPAIFARQKPMFIHNGIGAISANPEPAVTIREEIGISPSTPLCLMLGTYEPRKGHYFLFQAFKKVLKEFPCAHLLICGFGFPDEIALVRKSVDFFQLEENVHLMDFRKDLSHLLSQTAVLVVASQEFESFGYTSVEAMAHRVPVVATNIGGIPEVVADGEGGYCVGNGDVDSFACCIIKLLKDDDLRRAQGERGYSRFRKYFTAERMSCRYAEMIHDVSKCSGYDG